MTKTFLPSDFMERVVAWPGPDGPGYVNLHWQSPDTRGAGFNGRPFKDPQAFMELTQRAAVKPSVFKEIYFCLSTQRTTGKLVHGEPVAHRHAKQAILVKSLWIDVDVKPEKGYATLKEARSAIAKFLDDAAMPPPSAIVHSGGGIHVYWISDKPLTPAEWEPYAHGLRAELQKHGLKCDAGLTTDIARVLRVPGTYNNKIPKVPRPVVCTHLGASYDFSQEPGIVRLATIVTTTVKSKATATVTRTRVTDAPFDLSRFPPGKMAPMFMGVLDPVEGAISGLSGRNDAPLKLEQVVNGCTHFQDCEVTHGKLHPEPLWQLTLLAASFFEDGRELAHTYSKGYPAYSHEETEAKFDQKLQQKAEGNLGWPGCDAFEAAGAKCKQCPFYKKLRSPLNLAERAVPPPVQGYVAATPPDDLMLPDGYTTNEDGWICEIVTRKTSNGLSSEEEVPLFMCKLRKPECQGGVRALLFETSLDGLNWGPVKLLEVNLSTEALCIKQLRECGVKPFPRNQGKIIQFMTSWMTLLDKAKARIQTAPFGWLRPDGETPTGFAYGGKVFLTDGTEQTAGYTDPQLSKYYMPTGTPHQWHAALKVVTDQKHPALEAITATSFAAPLMIFTGLYNCIAHAWSNGSGAHKSFSLHIGAGVWGSPKMTKESPTSSPKGIIHKLGEIKNLPVYWDEISDDGKLDQIRPMLGIMTEGGGATNLRQDRTFHVKDEWQTLTLVGANKSLTENIVANIKDTDAQLQRVFEFLVEKRDDTMNPSDADLLINSLDYNYGHVGMQYAKLLGTKHEDIKKLVISRRRKFDKAVGHKSEERFRSAMATCIYVGAELANAHLGTHFNLPELWDFLRDQYLIQRRFIADAEVVGGSIPNTINATTQFFKAHTRNVLWVRSLPVVRAGKPAAIAYVAGPRIDHPDPVHVRMAVTNRVIEISREQFLKYLKNVDQNGSAVLTGLKKHFGAEEEAKISLSAGAGVAGGREHVIRIPVPNTSPFVEDLFKHATIEERLAAGLDETPVVTAAVTPEQVTFKKGPEPDKPQPVETGIGAAVEQAPRGKMGGLGAAAEQAAKDLSVVRRGTS